MGEVVYHAGCLVCCVCEEPVPVAKCRVSGGLPRHAKCSVCQAPPPFCIGLALHRVCCIQVPCRQTPGRQTACASLSGVQTPLVICALCLQENLLPPPTAEVLKKKKKKFTEHSDAAEEADEFDYSVLELLFPFCVHTWHVCCVWQYLVSADIQLLSFADL